MITWWTIGDVAVIDETNALEFVLHASGGEQTNGRDGYKALLSSFLRMFSKRELVIDDLIAEGDRVVMRYTWRAVHAGQSFGLTPTNNQVTSRSLAVYRVAHGKIVEEWEEHDTGGLTQQLGASSN
jgi:predicted ester cyclase